MIFEMVVKGVLFELATLGKQGKAANKHKFAFAEFYFRMSLQKPINKRQKKPNFM